MKKVYLGLTLALAVFALACPGPGGNNGNTSANANASPQSANGNGNGNANIPTTLTAETITITITNASGQAQTTIDKPNPTVESGMQVVWVVLNPEDNNVTNGATVKIEQFVGKDTKHEQPFGTTPGDNRFITPPLQPGSSNNLPSNPFMPNAGESLYDYTVTLVDQKGRVLNERKPQIIVGTRKVAPSPTPTTTASPKATPVKN